MLRILFGYKKKKKKKKNAEELPIDEGNGDEGHDNHDSSNPEVCVLKQTSIFKHLRQTLKTKRNLV